MNLKQLSDIAIQAAQSAGRVIQKHMKSDIAVVRKQGGTSYASQIVTAVDTACETVILEHLRPTCKTLDIALLSEETEDDGGRFKKDFFWCIDPMDGTLAFVNKQPGFSVSIALITYDGTPHIGIVYDPCTNTMYHAIKGHGAYKNGQSWTIKPTNNHLTYVTDRKLKDTDRSEEIEKILQDIVEKLNLTDVQELAGGGSVLNAIRVLENNPGCLMKFPKKENGGGSIWDFAATACIYHELGLYATNFEGGRLDLNKKDGTFMNHEGVFFASFDSR